MLTSPTYAVKTGVPAGRAFAAGVVCGTLTGGMERTRGLQAERKSKKKGRNSASVGDRVCNLGGFQRSDRDKCTTKTMQTAAIIVCVPVRHSD